MQVCVNWTTPTCRPVPQRLQLSRPSEAHTPSAGCWGKRLNPGRETGRATDSVTGWGRGPSHKQCCTMSEKLQSPDRGKLSPGKKGRGKSLLLTRLKTADAIVEEQHPRTGAVMSPRHLRDHGARQSFGFSKSDARGGGGGGGSHSPDRNGFALASSGSSKLALDQNSGQASLRGNVHTPVVRTGSPTRGVQPSTTPVKSPFTPRHPSHLRRSIELSALEDDVPSVHSSPSSSGQPSPLHYAAMHYTSTTRSSEAEGGAAMKQQRSTSKISNGSSATSEAEHLFAQDLRSTERQGDGRFRGSGNNSSTSISYSSRPVSPHSSTSLRMGSGRSSSNGRQHYHHPGASSSQTSTEKLRGESLKSQAPRLGSKLAVRALDNNHSGTTSRQQPQRARSAAAAAAAAAETSDAFDWKAAPPRVHPEEDIERVHFDSEGQIRACHPSVHEHTLFLQGLSRTYADGIDRFAVVSNSVLDALSMAAGKVERARQRYLAAQLEEQLLSSRRAARLSAAQEEIADEQRRLANLQQETASLTMVLDQQRRLIKQLQDE